MKNNALWGNGAPMVLLLQRPNQQVNSGNFFILMKKNEYIHLGRGRKVHARAKKLPGQCTSSMTLSLGRAKADMVANRIKEKKKEGKKKRRKERKKEFRCAKADIKTHGIPNITINYPP